MKATPTARKHQTSLYSYVVGYVSAIFLTLIAFSLASHHSYSRNLLIGLVIGLALVQFFAQVVFFLHIGQESKPRWRLSVLLFMTMIVLILVIGSVWIMNNLNYHMTPQQVDQYLKSQDGGI